MMKKTRLINILSLILFIVVGTSCSKYLDIAPDERLEVNTLDDVEASIVAAYQNERGYRFTFLATDNATAAQNVFEENPIIEDLYTWSRDVRTPTHQDAPYNFWVYSYNAIAQANLALEALENIEITTENKDRYNELKGEALLVRAYNHFMLVNIFANQYSGSASSDLGIPYVTKLENKLIVDYERNTVEEVYAYAEEDMKAGIELIEGSVSTINKNKYRFTLPTMYLFASRFYTFRDKDTQDEELALEYSQKSIDAFGGEGVMRPWSDYERDNLGPVDVKQPEVGMVRKSATWMFYPWNYQMTNTIRDKQLSKNPFRLEDSRLQIAYTRTGDVFTPAFYAVPSPSAGFAAPYNDIFPIAEAILNKAEAAIRLGKYDEAKSAMEAIGSKVYESFNPSMLSTDNLEKFYNTNDAKFAWTKYLLFERRNMFLLRGMRWFDIRRYPQYILDVAHKMQDGSVILLSEKNPDRNFEIPKVARNTGMTPNGVKLSRVASTTLIINK